MDANEKYVEAIVAKRAGVKPSAKSSQVAPNKVASKRDTKAKHAGGRPRKYEPAMLEEVLLSAADGATWDAIGDACGVDPRTAQEWCEDGTPTYNAEFHRAVKRAKDKADNLTLSSLFHRANGYEYTEQVATPSGRIVELRKPLHPDPGSAKSWLANRISWSGETQNVNVNNVTPIVDDIPHD